MIRACRRWDQGTSVHFRNHSPLAAFVVAAITLTSAAATLAANTARPAATNPVPGVQPWQPAPPRYNEAPEFWRSYFLKAREADAIADPMQRCLAFPPIPGSRWPANLIPAHCEYIFGLDLSLDKIKQHLDANDVAGLEAIFRKLHDRHFSETDFSEHIHSALELFDGDYKSGAISKRWLDAAPDSPFAMTARADFYRGMGWAARGGAYSRDTPTEQVARMHEFHNKAKALYEQALAKEPQLMHAHAGLVNLARNGNSDAVFEAGYRIDPACKVLLSNQMLSLLPRWGGSYAEMFALEAKMLAHLDQRPLLALSRIWPYDDMRDVAYAADQYADAVAALKPMVAVSSSPQVYEDLAAAMHSVKDADRWEQLAYMVQVTRFRTGDGWDSRQRGRLQLLLAGDAELANRSLAAAVKAEPDNFYAHYLYAASFGRLGKINEAEREYLVAMKDTPESNNHRDGLIELADLMLHARRGAKARAYAKQAITEYPDDARAWRVHVGAIGIDGSPMAPLRKALETFLAKVDQSDVRFKQDIEESRKALAHMREVTEKSGGKW